MWRIIPHLWCNNNTFTSFHLLFVTKSVVIIKKQFWVVRKWIKIEHKKVILNLYLPLSLESLWIWSVSFNGVRRMGLRGLSLNRSQKQSKFTFLYCVTIVGITRFHNLLVNLLNEFWFNKRPFIVINILIESSYEINVDSFYTQSHYVILIARVH